MDNEQYIKDLAQRIREQGYAVATQSVPDKDAFLQGTPLGFNTLCIQRKGEMCYVTVDGLKMAWAGDVDEIVVEEIQG